MLNEAYIIAGTRLAVGKFGGSLKNTPANYLGSKVIESVLEKSGIEVNEVDEVIMGNVIQVDPRGNPAREAALCAKLPVDIPAYTVNINCGSGLHSINLAAQAIRSGRANVIIAGGFENMSRTPYLDRVGRWGYRMGDRIMSDFLTETLEGMGLTAENVAKKFNVSREDQDRFAVESHRKACYAIEHGLFETEITPISVKGQKGESNSFNVDEGPRRDSDISKLSSLNPAFLKGGSVTAGNSSSINDGAAAVMIVSEKIINKYNLKPWARIIDYKLVGIEPEIMGVAPAKAIPNVLDKIGIPLDDIEIIELNEAFASQSLAVIRKLGLDPDKVNVNGGAIALGHPLGASGAILVVKLIHEMKRRSAIYGLVSLCIGGGEGIATVFENLVR